VVTTGAGRVDLLEQERWVSPPSAESAALSLAISGEHINVFRTPTPARRGLPYQHQCAALRIRAGPRSIDAGR
jgi:hypothetical protein